jgi:hypothetical protein
MKAIMAYDILSTPALVINDKVVTSGRIPTKAEVQQWLASKPGESILTVERQALCTSPDKHHKIRFESYNFGRHRPFAISHRLQVQIGTLHDPYRSVCFGSSADDGPDSQPVGPKAGKTLLELKVQRTSAPLR